MVKIKIVKNLKGILKQSNKKIKDIERGKAVKSSNHILYFTPESFSSAFSPERIKLLISIREKRISSIKELAKNLQRPYEAVHRDVKYLEGLKLIGTKKLEKVRRPIAQKISFLI